MKLGECDFCKEYKGIHARSMCKACYSRAWRNGGIPIEKRKRQPKSGGCSVCGEYVRIKTKGMCRACYQRDLRKQNPDRYKRYARKYYPRRKKKLYQYKVARRHRKRSLPCTLTEKEWEVILEIFNNRCAYCGKEQPLQKEHWIPLALGGGYEVHNIVPSCKECNCKKGVLTGDEFFDKIEKGICCVF